MSYKSDLDAVRRRLGFRVISQDGAVSHVSREAMVSHTRQHVGASKRQRLIDSDRIAIMHSLGLFVQEPPVTPDVS